LFSLDGNNILRFSNQRIYFGEHSPLTWPSSVEDLIERAQAAKAQGRPAEALAFYRRMIEVEPKLRPWAELSIASVKYDAGDTSAINELANGALANSEAITPTGLPVALIACAYVERMPRQEQARFSSFVAHTLESLRGGRWWLSYDERSFYDGQLREMVAGIEAKAPTEDRELKHLAAVEQIVRRSLPPANERYLLIAKNQPQPASLWRVPAKGGQPERLDLTMKGWLTNLRVHPDGRRIAFDAGEEGKEEVWVMENFLPAKAKEQPRTVANGKR
jgi:hypothetical protein